MNRGMESNMKILFIFTGGTIGSTVGDEYISVDSNKPYILLERYKELYGLNAEVDVVEPYTELSENNSGDTIYRLVKSVMEGLKGDYDGIIVTHGTDTLQYSAAALAYAIGGDSVPICLVSSNKPIEDESANGLINLHGAVKFIEQRQGRGVYVVYKNDNDYLRVHRGTRLLASNAFSDCVYSVKNCCYGYFDNSLCFVNNSDYTERKDEIERLSRAKICEVSRSVIRLDIYPGIKYPILHSGLKYIIIGSYHSGTINTVSDSAINFFSEAREKGIGVFMTGVSRGIAYESTSLFDKLGIIPLYNIAPIAAYVKLWMCCAEKIEPKEVMGKSLSGDIF
jgi:L-asparaginase